MVEAYRGRTGESGEDVLQAHPDAAAAVMAGEICNSIAVAGILAADRAQRNGFDGLRPADAPWSAKPDLAGR